MINDGFEIVKDELYNLEKFMMKNIVSPQKMISSAVEDLLNAGGKRIRPALTILVGKALGNSMEKLIPIASSMEIIHMATLVHDDVVDDANLRRGRPTVQSKFGKDVAVFTGDYLLSKAFSVIANYASKEKLVTFADVMRRICEGEIEQYESRRSLEVSLHKYLRRIGRKTGALIALSCVAGVTDKRINPKVTRNLFNYGMHFGLAFQITDDILDFTGNQDTVGKPVWSDIREGVYTLPLIYALRSSDYSEELNLILKEDYLSDDNMNKVIDIVLSSGGINFSQSMVDRYVDKGLKEISILKKSPYRDTLENLIINLKNRDK